MSLVQTSVGLVNKDKLVVKDVVTNEENARVLATEWFLEGILVRRDVNVNILNGIGLTGTQESI